MSDPASHRNLAALATVFVGGAAGTAARYAIEERLPHTTSQWPLATFGINIVGAFVLGLLLESLLRSGPDTGGRRRLRLLGGSGFCGAFTTYSTFALETVEGVRGGFIGLASAYAVVSVVLGVVAAGAGIMFANRVIR
ncbi:CrcB family protein [Rhodococcus sp. 05-2256-B2]|uniref:CrcB family protein n=1 Tax=Nocardiaceae TaxID=85025 RepID=UPI0009B92CFD|nr:MULTISPECIES: CrcB family protein [Rhodococcus]OZD51314.1 CrcB family protein [Rhodococcus sp. 06-1477-1B]OZD46875.1 CrcB family protein [Rhodococcus sp. 06-1474-1B]OZD77135.1 CrcB family protein [Rhodococcus sp. 05-2256-B4]OZD88254.1 CrcB family protein [Rhodococcus sp. 05-2256-B3]OZD98386.1 CrcB family protein [Rhodococcus sp. 05-2256-B2]